MDTCISSQDIAFERLRTRTEESMRVDNLLEKVDSSPLRRALRAHFESYGGLVEPRREIADVALSQDRDNI